MLRDTIEEVLDTGDMSQKVDFLKDGIVDPKLQKLLKQEPERYQKFLKLQNPSIHYGVNPMRAQELQDIALGMYYYGPLSGEPFAPIPREMLTKPELTLLQDALEYCSID